MISNLSRNTIISSRHETANDPWSRMKGLLSRCDLPQGEALVITHCQSIHMFFMKFPIDVIFCDKEDKVVGMCLDIKPFCLSPLFFRSSYAIELPTGSITASKTQLGDKVQIQ